MTLEYTFKVDARFYLLIATFLTIITTIVICTSMNAQYYTLYIYIHVAICCSVLYFVLLVINTIKVAFCIYILFGLVSDLATLLVLVHWCSMSVTMFYVSNCPTCFWL